MVIFEDIQELSDWLEPMDYVAFWDAVEPYHLTLQDRDHCDDQISSGEVPMELVLSCLKTMARIELTTKLGLTHRSPIPVESQYVRSVH